MRVDFYDLDNVMKCIHEVMLDANVRIDFSRSDFSSNFKHESVGVSIRDEEHERTLFCSDYDNIFSAYPILLGIYYGICIAKDKPFDYDPTPAGADWAE